MFELPKKTVHSIVSKMIIKEELLVCGVWVGMGGIKVRVRVKVRVGLGLGFWLELGVGVGIIGEGSSFRVGGALAAPKAAKAALASHLGGCEGMPPPQKNFENLVLRDVI